MGNYWNNYSGEDENGDGIGESPYFINLEKDEYPLFKPFENYQWEFLDAFDFEKNFQYLWQGKIQEGKTKGILFLYQTKLKTEGEVPDKEPEIYLIATDGLKNISDLKNLSFSSINYSQIGEKRYNFSVEIENPPFPQNNGHYEIFIEIGGNPFFVNTDSKIDEHYLPLIEIPLPLILISEIHPNPKFGKDPENEWVILYNTTNENLNISNWKICNKDSCTNLKGVIFPKQFSIVTPKEHL